jgi:hypothetical protein
MPDELKKASGDTSATPAAVAAGMVRWLNEGERIETTWNLTAFLSPELFSSARPESKVQAVSLEKSAAVSVPAANKAAPAVVRQAGSM